MKVICQRCREKEEKSLMQKERYGYYHPSCYVAIEEEERQKAVEFEDWCELYEFIKEIHSMSELPRRFVANLQDIRNGTIRSGNGKFVKGKSKEGISYKDMKLAYSNCLGKIQKTLYTMDFQNEYGQLQYCFSIVHQEIVRISTEKQKNSMLQQEQIKTIERVSDHMKLKESIDKKKGEMKKDKKEKIDLTRLLEDD